MSLPIWMSIPWQIPNANLNPKYKLTWPLPMLILGAPWHCHEHWLWFIWVGHWLGFSICLLCLDPGFRFRIIMRFTIDIIFKHDTYIYIYIYFFFVVITYPSLAQHKCKFQWLCERWWHWIWILAFYIDVGYWYVDIDIGCWVWILDMDIGYWYSTLVLKWHIGYWNWMLILRFVYIWYIRHWYWNGILVIEIGC